jgi:hypothetical protein
MGRTFIYDGFTFRHFFRDWLKNQIFLLNYSWHAPNNNFFHPLNGATTLHNFVAESPFLNVRKAVCFFFDYNAKKIIFTPVTKD